MYVCGFCNWAVSHIHPLAAFIYAGIMSEHIQNNNSPAVVQEQIKNLWSIHLCLPLLIQKDQDNKKIIVYKSSLFSLGWLGEW